MNFKITSLVTLLGASQLCTSISAPANQRPLIASQESLDHVTRELRKSALIPDVIDDFTPQCHVSLFYGKKDKYAVNLGNELKPKKTKSKPNVHVFCPGKSETQGMTIVLTDPDAPTRKDAKWGEFCHWIAAVGSVSLDGGRLEVGMESDVVDYKAPAPPKKTGAHRYAFVLLEGVNTNLTEPDSRKRWGYKEEGHGVRDWAEKEGLKVVGANFFYAKNKKQ